MSGVEPLEVLVVVGDPELANVVAHALAHPRLRVETAVTELAIVDALTTRKFELVVVGGRVGKRGSLVLCDVVRVRQSEAAVVVLLGEDADEKALQDHFARQLARVQYVDLRGMTDSVDRGQRVRAAALLLTQLDEHVESAAAWPAKLAEPESQAPATEHVPEAGAPAVPDDGAIEPEPTQLQGESQAAEVFAESITDEDLLFATRTVARARGVDFRSEPPPLAAEGVDRGTIKLRERVRELERQLARFAHVYGGRSRDFDRAATRIATLEADRQAAEQRLATERESWRQQKADRDSQLDALSRRAELLDVRLREAATEAERLREETRTREAGFASMLEQAREAFGLLRDQSAQAVTALERRAVDLERQLQAVSEQAARDRDERLAEVARLRETHAAEVSTLETRRLDEIAALRATHLEEASSLRSAHRDEIESLRAASADLTARLTEADRRLDELAPMAGKLASVTETLAEKTAQLAQARTELDELTARAARLKADLDVARDHEAESVSAAERHGREQRDAKEAELAAALERAKGLAGELREAEASRAELERQLAAGAARTDEKQQQLQELERRLAERASELEEQRRIEAGLRQELERAGSRALDRALDARLIALEEHARLFGEAADRQTEVLAAIDERTLKHGTLVDRLLRIIEPADAATGGTVTPVMAAQRLAERIRVEPSMGQRLASGLGATPRAVWIGVAAVVVLLGALLIGLRSGSKPDAASAPAAAVAVARPAATPEKPAPERAAPERSSEKPPSAATPEAVGSGPETAEVGATAKPAAPAKVTLTPDEKKTLRRKFMDAYKGKRWAEASDTGQRLRAGAKLDWEAELALAECLREADRLDEAREVYAAFLADFPTNRYADSVRAAMDKLGKK